MQRPPILPRPCPEGGGRFVRLASPKVGSLVSGLVYSCRPLGFDTHWIGGRTHPCLGTGPECIGHAEGVPVRWKCYLFGRSDQTHGPVLFEIPKETYKQTLTLRDPGVSLRGAAIRLWRVGPNNNSPVGCQIRVDVSPESCPVEEPDILAWLCVIWGCTDPREQVAATEGGRADEA